jgi:hydroxymethylbilane synthase
MKIICRKSNLSKAQGELARQVLTQHFPDVSIDFLYKETSGDLDQTTPLYQMVDKNVFSSDIDAALMLGSADFAVHSLKDVGEERLLGEGDFAAAVFERECPHDVVIFKPNILDILKENRPLSIGTSSLRREELVPPFLQKALPFNSDFNSEINDFNSKLNTELNSQLNKNLIKNKREIIIKPIRGNVETRLRKLINANDYDGIVLAAAGLNRLLNSDYYLEAKILLEGTLKMWLPLVECPPALGQGALLIECLKTNERAVEMLKSIDNQELKAQLLTERAATLDFGKGCHQRFGAIFIENTEGGDCVISNGKTAEGHSANRFVFDIDKRLNGKKIVSATDFMREFFDYKFYTPAQTCEVLQNLAGLNNTFFIAHHRAATTETLEILRGSKNWASGTKTWFELAKKGIWVEGCADGFGIDFLTNVWASPLANISEKELILLTNEDSALDWQKEGRKAIATYRLITNPSEGLIAALRSAEVVFWTSFKQFEACKHYVTEGVDDFGMGISDFGDAPKSEIRNPKLIHACPAGKTARKLRELGLEPAVFPSIKAFLEYSKFQISNSK